MTAADDAARRLEFGLSDDMQGDAETVCTAFRKQRDALRVCHAMHDAAGRAYLGACVAAEKAEAPMPQITPSAAMFLLAEEVLKA